jgi:hypothetical protein
MPAALEDIRTSRQAVAVTQPKARRWVGSHQARIHSFVHDRDSVAVAFRVLRALPFGRALAPIDRVETEQVQRIAGPQPIGASGSGGNSRSKTTSDPLTL